MTPVLANTPVLETERLKLRAPHRDDWPTWRAFMASERSQFVRPRNEETTDGKAWRAFGHAIGHWVMRGYGSLVFTLKDNNTALGMTGPWHPEGWPERELGWTTWLSDAEGQGYAYEAACAARLYAFETLGWDTAVSYIDPENTRSIALAERLGATRDPNAKNPFDEPCLVYRHPTPEVTG